VSDLCQWTATSILNQACGSEVYAISLIEFHQENPKCLEPLRGLEAFSEGWIALVSTFSKTSTVLTQSMMQDFLSLELVLSLELINKYYIYGKSMDIYLVCFEEPNRNQVRRWGVKVYFYLSESENASTGQ
jgi:hypothetical protein